MESARVSTSGLTAQAFEGLLARLSPVRHAAAEEYEALRGRLIDYFQWRGSDDPESRADETLDRVARKLAEGEPVEHVHRYAHGVARLILLESTRERQRERAAFAEWHVAAAAEPTALTKARAECLDRCLRALPLDQRSVIVEYYRGEGRLHLAARKGLAERLGITYGALKLRAHRARIQIEKCLEACLHQRGLRAP